MSEPRIAVLIPAYNEELVIAATIMALRSADCDLQHVYVVDDRSTDNTAAIAKSYGVNVFTVPQNGGKARAQQAALAHFDLLTKYDWIIFLDGDTKVHPYFFTAMFKAAQENPETSLFVGQVKSVVNDHVFSASRAAEYAFGQDIVKTGQSNFGVVYVSPGCSSMIKSSVLAGLAIDPMTLAEDMDLTMQLQRKDGKIVYLSDAIVFSQDPNTLKDYKKQISRWHRGFWQVFLKHKVFLPTQLVDFYILLITVDALVFNKLVCFLLLALISPIAPFLGLLADFTVTLFIAFYAYFKTRRSDVVIKLPLYYWLSYVNFYTFVKAFFEIVVCRKHILAWNKVTRYKL